MLIRYGRDNRIAIPVQEYERMIRTFRGKEVILGPAHGNPPPGSIEEWVTQNITPVGIAAYLSPILVHEGRAEWVDDAPRLTLRFCVD